jgi:predicted dehydrogenase
MERKGGILAAGRIAELFTQHLISSGLKVAAVWSRDFEKARAFAKRFGIANAHGSYEDLVAGPMSISSMPPRRIRNMSTRRCSP